jgi:hypothetical protein
MLFRIMQTGGPIALAVNTRKMPLRGHVGRYANRSRPTGMKITGAHCAQALG